MPDPDLVGAVIAIAGGALALWRARLVARASDDERRRLLRSGALVGALAALWGARDAVGRFATGAPLGSVGTLTAAACALLGLTLLSLPLVARSPWASLAAGRALPMGLGAVGLLCVLLGTARLALSLGS